MRLARRKDFVCVDHLNTARILLMPSHLDYSRRTPTLGEQCIGSCRRRPPASKQVCRGVRWGKTEDQVGNIGLVKRIR